MDQTIHGKIRWKILWYWLVVTCLGGKWRLYVFLQNGLQIANEIDAYEQNEKTRYAITSTSSKSKLAKVISLKIVYDVN